MKKLWIDKGGMIGGIVGMAVSIVLMAVCIVLAVFMADIEDAFGGFVFSIVASAASLIVFVLYLPFIFIPSC